jgi:hypothetical protein
MPRPKSIGLVRVTLRLREQDVREARRQAKQLGVPYQHIIRGWAARGANDATTSNTGSRS